MIPQPVKTNLTLSRRRHHQNSIITNRAVTFMVVTKRWSKHLKNCTMERLRFDMPV
jgi:hypothetical protein